MPPISKTEARAFRRRWRAVNAAEIEELRATPLAVKFEQLLALMRSARDFGWDQLPSQDEEEVRQRWQRLRKAYGSG